MSRNLVETIRRHHAEDAPSALALLKRSDRLDRACARRSGEQGPHVPEGALRPSVRPSPPATHDPLIRDGEDFREATWEEATELIVSELTRIKSAFGADAIAGLASSRATNEDCYAMQRFMRAAIGTHNIDNCSRVCHSPTSFALRKSLGLSGATGTFDDIEAAGAAILMGANATEGHPVAGARIKQAALRGMKLVTIDPRRIELSDYGVLHLSPRPGSNAAIMLGLAHVVERDGFVDHAFLGARTEGYEAVRELIAEYTPADVQRISGIPAADLERAAHIYAEAENASILWGLGVTEHKYGSDVVQLICNLALMTGKVGRLGSALLPLRGQNNVQGSSDMGALPDTFTGYQHVEDEEVAQRFERRWGVKMKRERGLKIPEMFDAAVAGDLKAMWIFGEDVAQTDPNTTHVIRALESLEFLVCQEIFQTETSKYADVILPASAFLEKEGTFTNAERRVQHVKPAILPPVAGGRWPVAGGRWPVAADGTDSPILYTDRFEHANGLAHLTALPYKPPGSEASDEFPLVLVTGRRLQHYNAGTMTRRTGNLDLMDHDVLELHPDDAERLWISDGDLVSVRSEHGRIELPAQVTDRIEAGHVFTAFHFPEVRTNLLVGASADVNTSCPEYKVVAVDVRPVSEVPTKVPALAS